jgi:glycosyltransferase involved in cell wall biosynthesis
MSNDPTHLQHVLMVAYLYPPRESTATRRIVKFVKYLPQWGYRPVVLTTRTRGTLPDDAETLTFRSDEVTGPLHRAYRAYKLRHVPAQQRARVAATSPESRLERWRTACLIPDHQVPWYPLAVQQGTRIMHAHPIRVIYSTSPPETAHLVALQLKQRSGLPWVADFRDGWLFEPGIPLRLHSPLRRLLETHLERSVVHHADRIIVVNEVMADDFRQRYPQAADRVAVITNGYDGEDFARLRPHTPTPDKFRIVYTGSFALARWNTSIDGLLEALRMLQRRNCAIMEHLELVLAGDLTAPEQHAITQTGVAQNITLVGRVDYPQALQYQVDADVLLLVIAPGAIGVTTNKVFEYLATGRPILTLSGDTPAAQLVASLGAGLVVDPHNVTGICHALETFYAQWQAGLLPTRVPQRVRQFERRELTRKLATIFDSLVRP